MDQLYSSKEKLIKKTIEQKKIIKRDLKNFEKLVLASEQNPKNLDILLELAKTASQLNKIDIEISSLKKILSIKNSTKMIMDRVGHEIPEQLYSEIANAIVENIKRAS